MTLLPKARALIQLIRPELPLAAGFSVVLGQVVALGAFPTLARLGQGFALGFLLSSSAMIFNDYFDLEVDRINTPFRPLAAGLLSRREAVAAGVVSGALGLLVAASLSVAIFLLGVFVWIIGFLYNWKLKAAGVWGNLMVSTSVGMTFLMGGLSVGHGGNPILWVFALMAFFFDLAEEIAGDAMDMAGDQARGSRSLALVYGKPLALRVSGLLFGVMIGLTLLPIFWGGWGWGYALPISLMDALIVFFALRLGRSQTPEAGRAAMRRLYLSATGGLIIFLLGTFLR